MKKAELLFIPFPGFSHVAMALEMTKFLIKQDHRLSVTLILTKSPFDSKVGDLIDSSSSISKQHPRINFIILPEDNTLSSETNPNIIMGTLMEIHIPSFRDAVAKHIHSSKSKGVDDLDSPQVAGLVVDTLCSPMMDVADEFGIPKYSFFPSCAASLGLMLHLQTTTAGDHLDIITNPDPNAELLMPCFVNPVPVKVFPDAMLDKARAGLILHHIGRIRETKGVIMNTFMELETHTIRSLISSFQLPPLYPIGPILNMLLSSGHIESSNNNDDGNRINNKKPHDDIIKWLDDQPPLSVVFLCFGSVGYFSDEQVKEIGNALINCGIRFVWSLREPHKEVLAEIDIESEFSYAKRVLSKEFFHRTAGIGKVTGWAPQIAILSHPATGGFVSHCGWNSMLESVSFGVPVAAWPLYADHNPIAFQMVKELGLGVEVRLDYRLFPGHGFEGNEETIFVTSREIEMAIRKVMEVDSDIRKRVKEMSPKCNTVFTEGGSSYSSMLRLINDVVNNMPDNKLKS